MKTCNSCGGLIGRDCFNPTECAYIAQQQAQQNNNDVASTSFQSGYKAGYKEGLTAYAWWKDGVQYVGTCGTTLKEALKGIQ